MSKFFTTGPDASSKSNVALYVDFLGEAATAFALTYHNRETGDRTKFLPKGGMKPSLTREVGNTIRTMAINCNANGSDDLMDEFIARLQNGALEASTDASYLPYGYSDRDHTIILNNINKSIAAMAPWSAVADKPHTTPVPASSGLLGEIDDAADIGD